MTDGVEPFSGVIVRGVWEGFSDGPYPRAQVRVGERDGRVFTKRLDARLYDPQTGASTGIGAAVDSFKFGDTVEFLVYVGTATGKDGTAFATYRALAARLVSAPDRVDIAAVVRNGKAPAGVQ